MAERPLTVAVASGKGGTGKSCVAASLLVTVPGLLGADVDVEEPNLALLLGAEAISSSLVEIPWPVIDDALCDRCGECVKNCRFGALLTRHGIAFERLPAPVELPVISSVYASADNPDGAFTLLEEKHHNRVIPAGALRVAPCGQDRRLLALLLDPRSASSVFHDAAYARLLAPGEPSFITRAA